MARASKKTTGGKTTRKSAKASPKGPTLMARFRTWFFRPSRLATTALFLGILVLGPYVIHLIPELSERDEYQYPLSELRLSPPHEWVPSTFVQDVLDDAELPETVSLLDTTLTRDLAEAFANHPWVQQVEQVRITPDRQIEVAIAYRHPRAMVELSAGTYPIDEDGVLLPPSDFSPADIGRFPLITGIATPPQGPAGTSWGSDQVLSAAHLAVLLTPERDLDKYWNRFGLKAIRPLSPGDGKGPPTFVLKTVGESEIIWGHAPGADELEPTAEQKIGRLEYYLSQYGSFDQEGGPYRIDIREFQAITLEPLEMPQYR